MPPSPAMRISPGRTENHKRGRSLESGVRYREKDDDLALFNEVQNKESDNFLLQSSDDFDDLFSTKLRHFSDGKLEISIPARGESSDLLNAEGDKNDYDWLITPPETPLFPSLDDETPQASLVPRGRPRSQPISISRSSTMEKGYRSARSSASPHRLSPSPRSGNSPLQSRSKPFSATHSSPPPTLRHSSPSRKLSPPPSKSSPAPRSSTPTPRRMSTGSAGPTPPSRVRGTSPISRGNSASPKIKAWQSNIPGFSLEAPPNLRTSLADRPASYVRGSSPASRNGRQSMSPTASRSVSSSHSHDRPFSSQSKGSVASSGDDDVDSLHSNPLGNSDRSAPRGVGSSQNNRVMGFSKKPTKILSSSAPKRSFDMALRQMDRKTPQNMFRPLLSSVPSSTFYAGKASAHHHRSLVSRNSSITTSSNASSDLATNGALDTEESEQNPGDVTSDFVKAQFSNVHDGVFVMDQTADALKEDDIEIRTDEEIDNHPVLVSDLDVTENSSHLDTATAIDTTDVVLDARYGYLSADGTENMETCSICARRFPSSEFLIEGNLQLCQECKNFEVNSNMAVSRVAVLAGENTTGDFVQVLEHGSLDVLDQSVSVKESLPTDHSDAAIESQYSYNKSIQDQPSFAMKQIIEKPVDSNKGLSSNSKIDVSEGMGISLLLKRSSSGKGHIVQNRSLTATSISYDDFSYVRDSVNSMRSSIGYSSASMASSIDMGSSRQTEMTHIHRQPSWPKSDMENYRYEMPTKHKRSASSLSGASSHVFQVPSVTPSSLEDSFEVIAANTDEKVLDEMYADPCEKSRALEFAEGQSTCTDAEGTSHLANFPSEDPTSHGNDEISAKCSINLMNEKTSNTTHFQASSEGEDDDMASSCGERGDVAEVPYPGSLDAIVEMENVDILSADSQSDGDFTNSKSCMNELMEPSVSVPHNEEFDISDHLHGVDEESIIVLEDNLGRTKSRSLTMEEATDTILFCSSIVHNLAYEAANIAIDKESSPMEILRPTITFLGKSNSDRSEMRIRPTTKRGAKSQKAQQKKLETDQKPPSVIAESTEKSSPRIVRDPSKDDSMKPLKLESKCNCIIM